MKIIIWGHKLYSHTSSYVHYGYEKAFRSLGYETLWCDDNDDVSNINFDDCLFLTEGQVDKNIPMNKSCKYVLHNCDQEKYTEMPTKLNIQFFHNSINSNPTIGQHSTFTTRSPLTKVNNYTFFCKETLYQPWATDLLPNEIDLNNARNETKNKECIWIGTYGGDNGEFQNHKQLDPFFNECKKHNIIVTIINPWAAPVSPEENKKLVNRAFLAPSIQGEWQAKYGYLSCRLMKNISYGHFSITNNKSVNELFDNKLIYDDDPIKLFYKSMEKKHSPTIIDELKFLMDEIKEKHTYINRARQILEMIP